MKVAVFRYFACKTVGLALTGFRTTRLGTLMCSVSFPSTQDNQKDLEMATETLSEYLERDITSECLSDIKQKVQDKYRYVLFTRIPSAFLFSLAR